MDKITKLSYDGINNYFNTLATLGYKNYEEVSKLLVLLFIEEFIKGPFSLYIDEDDYKVITNTLYNLYGSTCLIPYPEYSSGTSLIQSLNTDTVRITEDDLIRISENEFIRLVNN